MALESTQHLTEIWLQDERVILIVKLCLIIILSRLNILDICQKNIISEISSSVTVTKDGVWIGNWIY
jgi:hypothetical protein